MVNLEAKKALAKKLNISYADIAYNDLFTDEDLQYYVNQGAMQAYDYTFWDFAEHSKTATLGAGDITNGYVAYPQDILPSSIYYLTINGQEFTKKNFASFKKWFQDNPTDQGLYWAEFKRLLFFNKNMASAGQVIDIYGRRGFRQLSGDNDLLPFSPDTDNEESSGNEACVLFAYAEILASEKKKNPQQAEVEIKKARAILDLLASQQNQGHAIEQSKNRPMFDVPNLFPTGVNGNASIGTFNY